MRVKVLVFTCFILLTVTGYSQPSKPNSGKKPGTVPISGIEYLIGLGGLYGLKKLLGTKKKTDISD